MFNAKNDDYRVLTSDFDFASYEVQRQRGEEIARMYLAVVNLITKQIFGRIATWYARQRLSQDLEALDDRLLADIGIARHEIPAAVKAAHPYVVEATKVAVATDVKPMAPVAADVAVEAVNDRHAAQAAA
jgi:uncharacterized protein YjiS (DUF1127 family)